MSATRPGPGARRQIHLQWRLARSCRARWCSPAARDRPSAAARSAQARIRAGGRCAARAAARSGVRLQMVTGAPSAWKRGGDGARSAAGAQDQRRAGGGVHAMGAQIGDETVAVGIGARSMPSREHQRVHRPGAAGGSSTRSHTAKAASLCGIVTLAPAKPGLREARTTSAKCSGAHGQRQIGAIDPVAVQPGAVEPGGAGMGDRPADDTGEAGGA